MDDFMREEKSMLMLDLIVGRILIVENLLLLQENLLDGIIKASNHKKKNVL